LEEDKKKKDKQDDEDGDKDGTMGFQQPTKRVNVIYEGDSSFNRRNQKHRSSLVLELEEEYCWRSFSVISTANIPSDFRLSGP